MSDILSEFTDSIRRSGLTPPGKIVADGKIHRFRSGPEKAENGYYRLVVVPAHRGGDIGFGTIGCWKRGIQEKWCSREPGSVTEHDRSALDRARQEMREAAAAEAKAAAEKAVRIWEVATAPDEGHPYLAAKRIGPAGLRQYKGALVIPVRSGGEVVSLQFIAADGTKRFLSGGRMEGGYASISSRGGPKDRIVIAEGYATASSIHEATGLPVVASFFAGNLLPVARAIRQKFPDAELVFGADQDLWTVIRGKKVNVGLVRATAAAEAVGGSVVFPPFHEDDVRKPSDFNDAHVLYGLQAVRDIFDGKPVDLAPPPEFTVKVEETQGDGRKDEDEPPPPPRPRKQRADLQPEPDPPQPRSEPESGRDAASPVAAADHGRVSSFGDWRARLIPGKQVGEGHPFPFDPKSKTNAYLFLKHHGLFADLLFYNEFTDSVMLMREPPWGEKEFSPRAIRDDDFFMLAAHLEYCDLSVSKETAADATVRVAKDQSINPPREYLSRLTWDGKPRIDSWLTYYLGADEQPSRYLSLVGSKWLIGAVSRVFEPGCKFDSVLILEGSQGLGKSMALRSLATFNGQDFFLDSVGDIRSKDTLMTMQGKLIVEIAELASFRKSENEEIKAFITRQVDEYRPPYGRTVMRRPRYFVLAGSTNEMEEGYLTDDTGNRRYWPVKCKSIDADSVERDCEQLWAEAVERYHAGERTWLTPEEASYSVKEQKSRFMEDAWQERIAVIVKGEWFLKIDDVLAKLELKPRDINNMVKKRVKNSLRQLGWYETRRTGEGRVWRAGDSEVVHERD